MNMLRTIIAVAVLIAFASPAAAERRWFVDASGVIVTMTDDDGAHTPDGTTAVLDATIRMANPPGPDGDILWQGVWDGTTYTAPVIPGAIEKIDPATGRGQVQLAARAMLDTFLTALAFLDANQLAWQTDAVKKTETAIYWQTINCARVALNSTRTHANRVKFLEEAMSWPMGFSGEVRQLADYVTVRYPGDITDSGSASNPF